MVELLVATVCLAVTSFGILTAIAFADNQNALARQRSLALSFASTEMERYRSKAFANSLVAGVFNTDLSSSALPQPAQETTTVSTTGDPMVFTVTVQVTWTVPVNGAAMTRGIHLDTALRNNDVP